MRGNIGTQEKSTSCLQDVAMLALSDPVLGVSPRTGQLRQGALKEEEGAEGLGEIPPESDQKVLIEVKN